MSLTALLGHACGRNFKAAEHLASHPEFAWQKGMLRDMNSRGWTKFTARWGGGAGALGFRRAVDPKQDDFTGWQCHGPAVHSSRRTTLGRRSTPMLANPATPRPHSASS